MSDLTGKITDLSDADFSPEQIKKMHLLAASAGTGKTYSIQTLYLRLVLVERLTVQQILVVTFTRDATKELRDRLQSVLRGALDYLNGVNKITDAKDRTKRLVDAAVEKNKDGKKTVKHLLQLALLDFDMAAIYTIHGFCQRVLNRFAFETNQAFDVEPTGDTSDEIEELCRDWWRKNMYSLDEKLAGFIYESGEFSLKAITTLARKIISKPDAILSPEVKCEDGLDDGIKKKLKTFPEQENESADFPGALSCIKDAINKIQEQLKTFRDNIQSEQWDKALEALLEAVRFEASIDNPYMNEAAQLYDACKKFMEKVPPGTQKGAFNYDNGGCLQSARCPDLKPDFTTDIQDRVDKLSKRVAEFHPVSPKSTKSYDSFYKLAQHFPGNKALDAKCLFEEIRNIVTAKTKNPENVGITEKVRVKVDAINPAFRTLADSLFEECRQSTLCAALAVKSKYQESRPHATSASYDDYLVNLRDALTKDGSRLPAVLRNEFRAALIDEFQDTDPIQWGIFEKLFTGANVPCFLVGDPKQAIYRFRNGDVETYQYATENIKKIPLDMNYRSEKRLIDAVNQIFIDTDGHATFGKGIEYKNPLEANGKDADKRLLISNNEDKTPLKIILIENSAETVLPGKNSPSAMQAYELTALEIARILKDDKLSIGGERIRKKDIAILVNKHEEGAYIAEELKELNIPSVRQGTGNVWRDTDEGRTMWVVMEAVLDSRNTSNVRRALLTSWCGLTVEQIQRLNGRHKVEVSVGGQNQSYGMEDWVAVFDELRDTWIKRGYPAMFRKMTAIFELKKKLLSADDRQGQRRLANINHLSEMMDQQIVENRKTPEGVLSWIRQQLDKSTAESGEEFLLRLETDDDAVRILTVFTSKGLEFPIVFAPTLFMMKPFVRRGHYVYEYHDDEGGLLVSIKVKDEKKNKNAEEKERQEIEREHIRQIYVALTRAVHRTVVVALNDGTNAGTPQKPKYKMKGILGEVLRLPMKKPENAENEPEKIVVDMDNVVSRFSNIDGVKCAVEVKEADDSSKVKPLESDTVDIEEPPKEKPKADTSKGHGSFSSLAPGDRKKGKEAAPAMNGESEVRNRDGETSAPAGVGVVEKPEGIFAFPYGAKTGTCWHEIFEDLAFNADDKAIKEIVEEKLSIHGFLKNKEKKQERIDLTVNMVEKVLNASLPKLAGADFFALKSIDDNDRKTEWEFSFSALSGKKTSDLKTVISKCAQYKPFTDALGEWDKEIPGGYLMGFVDLLFRKDNRYYIVDWKSNRRNGSQKDFDKKGLEEEISFHRYWLQYLIYSVAVHQYLSKALPRYEYNKHFGGVYYMFLRGVDGKKDPDGHINGIYEDRPPEDLVKELSEILGDFS